MNNTQSILPNTTPLCFMPDGKLVCYGHGDIWAFDGDEVVLHYSLFSSLKERVLGRCNALNRLLRLGIRNATPIDDKNVLISFGNKLFELDIWTGELSGGYYCGEGIRPLSFTTVKGIDGFDDGIYFGGYLVNMDKTPVSIYRRIDTDKWETVFTFPQGTINHVHNIIADHYRNCLWIFTGDFGEASAIWKVTDNFKKNERVLFDDQKYRACVVYSLPEGLLYATDTPFTDDYIYMLNPETMEVKELYPIHGSCIYGCQWKDKYVFSSTVECDGRDISRWEFLFSRKRGVAIKDNYVHLYAGNLQEGFKELYKERKDNLPYFTFQFGVFKFPVGVNNSENLYFYPVATKNDGKLMKMTEVIKG